MTTNTAPTFLIKNSPIITDLGLDDTAYSIKVQADGKIIVVGTSFDTALFTNFGYGSSAFGVVRYNSDGTLDTSFSDDGKQQTGDDFSATSSVLQSDGKILVAGTSGGTSTFDFSSTYDFTVARYNSDGNLDSTFGSGGIVHTWFPYVNDGALSVALQSDGKILLAGRAASGTNSYNFGLVRLNTDGSLDTAFGNGGKVTTDMGSANDAAFSTLVQSDGKIVLAGHSGLARYNSNGSLDNTFSGDGKLTTDYSISGAVSVWGGKLVAAGGNTIDRYKADGSLDTSFSGDGKVSTDFSVAAISVQTNGKLVVVGDGTLARYNGDGSLDTTFSGDGKAQVGFTAAGVTVQADGKILVTGSGPTFGGALSGNDHDFYTARYNANGSLDTTFNATFNTVGTAVVAQEGGATPTAIAPHALIQDAELDALNGGLGNYSGASLTLARHGGANAQDVLGVSGTLALSNGSVVLGGTVVGTYQQSPGQLTLLFGTATSAQVNSVLHQLTYTNSSQAAPTAIQLDWTFNDGDPTHPLATTAATPITIMASNSHADGHAWINGNHAAGQTLTASNDLTDPDGMAANTVFTYQWQGSSNGTTWSNLGSGANLVVTPATANQQIKLTATYTDAQGFTNSTSAIQGTAGNDTLKDTGYSNTHLSGLDGNDRLYSSAYNDILDGGNGQDSADYGNAASGVTINLALTSTQNTKGSGIDTLLSIEAINGSYFNDVLLGNTANNTLSGGNGNDLLAGSLGNDTLTGGLGQDTFAFNSALGAGNIDTITDFNVADDTIRLSKGIFTTLTTPGVLAAEAFKILGNGGVEDGSDHLLYNTATGALSYDADGSGAGAAVQIAILGTGLAMTNADFMVA